VAVNGMIVSTGISSKEEPTGKESDYGKI